MYRSRIRRNRPSAACHAGTHNIRKNRHVVNGRSWIMLHHARPAPIASEVTRRKESLDKPQTAMLNACVIFRMVAPRVILDVIPQGVLSAVFF